MKRPAARQERGFALLVIFLIAAAVAFTMYQELPRAAFESARDKEQLLMDRGNQYKRAIQVFYAVNKRYPAEIKDLENTGEKRYLRRRYIDPMTGQDEWRLIHTNGSFLTDSLVTKPPTQNAANGLPGAGQTPGGGPLGANNLNTAPAAPATPTANPNDPAAAVPAPLNAAAQRRPSDRGFPTGPGFPQPPGAFNPGNGANTFGANPVGANPANFNPDDPSTWPPITLAPPTAQPQPGQGQPQPGIAPRTGLPPGFQAQAQNGLGQLGGQGGANPQPSVLGNPNPLGPNGLTPLVPDPSVQNNVVPINPDNPTPPFGNQPAATPQPQPQPQQQQLFGGSPPFNASQLGNLPGAGFNPQNPNPPQPAATTGQPNPLPGAPSSNTSSNTSSNPALNAIDNSLFRPNQAPTTGPTGSPGIAGVASTFKGPSIKAYKERTKYQEWEFVYEPAANQPGASQAGANPLGTNPLGANQPGANQAGANPLGQPGAPAPNPFAPNSGAQTPGQPGAPASNNPFAPTSIFGPSTPTQ